MNKSTKPISSPGRTEKFPPPLMRFLRSNVGNKSRRRSRASPMFFRKKNTNIETIQQQEPSSPKVTCIGQVRVRRSKKKKPTAGTTPTATVRRRSSRTRLCRCFQKLKPTSFFNILTKWVSFFRCGCCKNQSFLHESPAIEATPRSVSKIIIAGDDQEQENENGDVINQGLISKSPPKNAFLLTRCRSAPYRSSSLANKFWESRIEKTGEEEEVVDEIKKLNIKKEEINGVNEESKCDGDEELKEVNAVPLILTKCKSAPARRWEKILV